MPKITLIDYTGIGHHDPLYAARQLIYAKNTRLEQGESTRHKIANYNENEVLEALKAVAASVRSSWEFVTYTFEMRDVSRACANQITRSRFGVGFAQQSMRSVDVGDFETRIPNSLSIQAEKVWMETMSVIKSAYKTLRELNAPTQDARGVLPLNIYTNLLGYYNLRALADMCGKRDNLRAQDEYADVAYQMKQEVYSVHPWARLFIEPERVKTPALNAILKDLLGNHSPVDRPEINAALKELDALKATWDGDQVKDNH